jgi:hypothetical protein
MRTFKCTQSTPVERILLLFVESGLVYLVLWVCYLPVHKSQQL